MKSIKYIFIATVLVFYVFSCKKKGYHPYITFVNKANMVIHVLERSDLITTPGDTFYICGGRGKIMNPEDSFNFDFGVIDTWDEYLAARPYIQYIVLSKVYTDDECTDDKIKDFTQKHQLKRYQLTKEDLDRMNWTITYP